MRTATAALALFACATAGAAEPVPEPAAARFSGGAALSAPLPHSADKRFVLAGELSPSGVQQSGRFALSARLVPESNALNATCGPRGDAVFANGFELLPNPTPLP